MTALTSPFVWVGLVSVAVGLVIAAVAWRQPDAPGARTYAILMAVLSVWSALYVGQLLEPSLDGKVPWLVTRHAISPLVAVLFWLFAARYTDRPELLSARYLGPIVGIGGVIIGLVLLNPGDLFWTGLTLYTDGSIPRVALGVGPAFWLMVVYVGVVVGAGHVYFVSILRDSFSVYRRQLTAMAVVGTIEFGLWILFLTDLVAWLPDLNPWPYVQLVTYNLVFVAAPLGWSYLRESLFDLQILDRQAVIENMDDAVFVFDSDDLLRSVNDAGLALIDHESVPDGASVSTVFAQTPVLHEAYRTSDREVVQSAEQRTLVTDGEDTDQAVELVVDGDQRWYDIQVSAIDNSAGERTGTVLVARDVTRRHRNRELLRERTAELETKTDTLERQNERLDQFASIVSHDLRNPLGIAETYLNFAEDTGDPDDFAAVRESLDRMDEMIDDLLTMARAETTVEETEPVALRALADEAWGTAQTDGASLENEFATETTVAGDLSLLRNVFENLFRNAVDHNDPPLTVRVGTLDDGSGFYIADDGAGIPPDRREDVFEFGHTTTEDGTGFGLAIVRELVTAHGWEIAVTDSDDGGARFEIS